MPVQQRARRLPRTSAALLIGLVVVVIAGGVLGSLSLLAHFGVLGGQSAATTPVRGGTWTDDFDVDPDSLIPNASSETWSMMVDQALYLPLFYGDAQGVIHAGAASEIPTLQNGGIGADAKTWTFHLRPGLVWSDGRPYDARDVDYTWKLWANPKFGAYITQGPQPDHLGRGLGGPPLDYLPPSAPLRAISRRPVGGWRDGATARASFQFDGTPGHQEVA